ncbi:MAG: sulfotransferase family 2 domain-containing protein [Anaerolineae bacterium]|nr:sulfotransferase family 2 domain-containing protein [Anaerolineae bacterium]
MANRLYKPGSRFSPCREWYRRKEMSRLREQHPTPFFMEYGLARLRLGWHQIFRQKQNKREPKQLEILSNSPPVSCICLNTGCSEHLEETIYSFLHQDYGGSKELIILNDDPTQTLAFDHPEVKIVNLSQQIRFEREKWSAAVTVCAHDLIFVWNAADISLPHRITVSVKKISKAEDHLHFMPSVIFIWENERVSGPYHNLFHKGSCWSRRLFDQVGGFRKKERNFAIFKPQLRTIDLSRYDSLMPDEVFYIFRGLNYVANKRQPPAGEIRLNPHWLADYSKLAQDQLTSEIAHNIDRSLSELSSHTRKNLTHYGTNNPRRYYIFEDRCLAYISTAKAACTSIKTVMMQPYGIHKNVHNAWPHIYLGHLEAEHQDFFKFSFVRNPFARLVSGYRNKIINKPWQQREHFGTIPTDISFSEFVAEVVKCPDCLINGHFQSQFAKLYHQGELQVDFLGRFENLAEDWLPIAKRFEFDPQLPHKMKSSTKRGVYKDYRTYYTEELVHLVYNRFRADVDAFGYQQAYEELLTFVSQK